MNFCKKGSIFGTFFGSCLALGLVIAALGTKWWVSAKARRVTNPWESDGRVNLGLFEGEKHLNVKYGWREYPISVTELVHNEREFFIYGAWIATIACLTVGLLFTTLSAVLAVLNTATNQYLTLTGIPGLYICNFLAAVLHMGAVILWSIQFTERLQQNVMSREDRDNSWTSEGLATLGYSFWLVVAAVIVHLLNIAIVFVATRERSKGAKTTALVVEEKAGGGAIMLY